MNVRRLESHGAKQPQLVAFLGEGGELDARAIGRQTAHYPALTYVHERIAAADRGLEKIFVENGSGATALRRPEGGGRSKRLGLARDQAATPLDQSYKALAAEAPQPGAPMRHVPMQAALRHRARDRFECAGRHLRGDLRQNAQLVPKRLRI